MKKRMVKSVCLSVFLAGSLALSSVPVMASSVSGTNGQSGSSSVLTQVDESDITHNEVQIDPFTGEPVTEDTGSDSSVQLDNNVTYDPETGMFVYDLSDSSGDTVSCSIADGMFTNGTVSLSCSAGLNCKVYINGVEQENPNLSDLSTPGSYVILFNSSGLTEMTSFSFRIIQEYTNAGEYDMPSGFEITEAYLDGGYAEYSSDKISFDQEGEYQVYYTCNTTGESYTLDCIVDHTAPTLALAAVDDSGYASSAVDLSDLEEGAQIYADLNGDSITPGQKLTQPGRYVITVIDDAGNTTVYSFVIRMYFTFSTVFFILLLLLLVGGLVGYIIISRRNLKVR